MAKYACQTQLNHSKCTEHKIAHCGMAVKGDHNSGISY